VNVCRSGDFLETFMSADFEFSMNRHGFSRIVSSMLVV